MREISAKAIFLGDASVGKSSLIKRYFENEFDDHIPNTIGTAFLTKTFENDQKTAELKLNVWDTCGQERFMAIASIYYRDANIIILVIDADAEKSLEMAEKYLWEIKNNAVSNSFIVLVVNKIDLLPKFSKYGDIGPELYQSCQFYDRIMRFMEANSLEHVFWTSAKEDGLNVKSIFDFLGNSILSGKIIVEGENKSSTKRIIAHSILKSQEKQRAEKWNCC